MQHRSWLFVPGDSEKKLGKAASTGADVIIVDLEDSVVPAAKPAARDIAARWLDAHRAPAGEGAAMQRWVRINALDSGLWRDDLAGVMASAPDGVMLPKAEGPESVRHLAAVIHEMEQRHGLPAGSTRILPLVSETARATLTIEAYAGETHQRLAARTWGAEDLSADIGASRKHDAAGGWADAFRLVRARMLLTAHACEVLAIDTLHADFADHAGLKAAAEASAADGFAGMLAIHPAQVPIINAAFTPDEAKLAEARAIVAAFEENPTAGAMQIAGRMIDRPHLRLARRMLGLAE